MLDSLVLHIPFKYEYVTFSSNDASCYLSVDSMPRNTEFTGNVVIGDDGEYKTDSLRTKFESLPSSHSGMAFKIFESGRNCDPFVMLKCSPCKLLQGHNLYGFDDMYKAALNMLALLANSKTELFGMLDVQNTTVSEFDITYSIFIENDQNKKMFLDHLGYVSKGHTKNRGENYSTTVYFQSKKSRLKRLKVYSKWEEMEQDILKLRKNGFNNSADIVEKLRSTRMAKQAVRFEATIKSRYLERRAIPTKLKDLCKYFNDNEGAYRALFFEAWKDVFDALRGQEMKKVNDNTVYKSIHDVYHTVSAKTGKISTVKVNRLFSFYQTVKSLGYQHVRSMTDNKSQFNRNVADLRSVGFSQSVLQNLKKDSGVVILPVARFIEIDFSNQFPADYVEVADLFAA